MNITDKNYINFKRVIDKSSLGRTLCKDLRELLLKHLREKCYKCFSCYKIHTPICLFEYVPENGKTYYACSRGCHDSLRECIKVCREFGDYN